MQDRQQVMKMGWSRFAAMIAVSTVIMFFLMYQLVYQWDHATFSINRLVASLAMGCVMTAVMLGFMWSMYEGQGKKIILLSFAVIGAFALLYANRSQSLVGDTTFMRSMIPHHSIAINNARKARLSDPRVRALADKIITSQVREIAEMQALIQDIDGRGERRDRPLAAVEAKVTADMLPQIEAAVR